MWYTSLVRHLGISSLLLTSERVSLHAYRCCGDTWMLVSSSFCSSFILLKSLPSLLVFSYHYSSSSECPSSLLIALISASDTIATPSLLFVNLFGLFNNALQLKKQCSPELYETKITNSREKMVSKYALKSTIFWDIGLIPCSPLKVN